MTSKITAEKKKVLCFGFAIYYAIDYKINQNAHKVIDWITSISSVKPMESVTRQHYGCNCCYCKLRQIIQEKLLERVDTYLIVPETLDYKEKDPPYPFHNN